MSKFKLKITGSYYLPSLVITFFILSGWCPPQRTIEDCLDGDGCWRLYKINLKDGYNASGDKWKDFGSSGASTLNTNFIPRFALYGYYTNLGTKSAVWLDDVNPRQFQFSSSGKMNETEYFLTCVTLESIKGLVAGTSRQLI